jgi:hypothetical protein
MATRFDDCARTGMVSHIRECIEQACDAARRDTGAEPSVSAAQRSLEVALQAFDTLLPVLEMRAYELGLAVTRGDVGEICAELAEAVAARDAAENRLTPVEGAVWEEGGVSLIRRGAEDARCADKGSERLYRVAPAVAEAPGPVLVPAWRVAAFEAQAAGFGVDFAIRGCGTTYADFRTHAMWCMWRAALNEKRAKPPEVLPLTDR